MESTLFSPNGRRYPTARRCLPHRVVPRLVTKLRLALRRRTATSGRPIVGLASVLALLVVGLFSAEARSDADICGYPVDGRVTIQREGETQALFAVSLAESASRHRRGLMHCWHLPAGHGMLFVYNATRPRVFWMKDTHLELAIIYIAADSRIAGIEKGVPRTLTRIPSPGPVRYVLEINYAEARGLRRGDRLQWTRLDAQP